VAESAHRVYVMYAGRMVESGPVEDVLRRPGHPYTIALLDAVPRLAHPVGRMRGIEGAVPSAGAFPAGCRFHPRCPRVQGRCRAEEPEMEPIGDGRAASCFFPPERGDARSTDT
jgi:oligopeptide/dipeptide ABC transporter ATP-binding protein